MQKLKKKKKREKKTTTNKNQIIMATIPSSSDANRIDNEYD